MKKLLLTLTDEASKDLEPYCVTTNPLRLRCSSVEMTEMGLLRVVVARKSQQHEPAQSGSGKSTKLLIPPRWIAWGLEGGDTPPAIGFRQQ